MVILHILAGGNRREMNKQIIWIYALCYNESHFVGNFLTAYKDAAKIVIYDNESTDNSVELLKQDPRVEIRSFCTNKEFRDDIHILIKNNCWKEARGKADWVIVVDFDEIFTRMSGTHDNPLFDLDLSVPYTNGFNIIKPIGYNMISFDAPLYTKDHPFVHSKQGTYHTPENKMVCFRPDCISEMNYAPGCHDAFPLDMNGSLEGIRVFIREEFKLLHFSAWNIDVSMKRFEGYQKRLSQINKDNGWGFQYLLPLEEQRNMYLAGMNLRKYILDIKI